MALARSKLTRSHAPGTRRRKRKVLRTHDTKTTLAEAKELHARGKRPNLFNALAARLQDQGAASFVKCWNELMAVIVSKSAALQEASSR